MAWIHVRGGGCNILTLSPFNHVPSYLTFDRSGPFYMRYVYVSPLDLANAPGLIGTEIGDNLRSTIRSASRGTGDLTLVVAVAEYLAPARVESPSGAAEFVG